MFALVVFLMAVYGLANAIAVLKAGKPIRVFLRNTPVLSDLVKCPPCLSFWIGMAVSLCVLSPASQVCTPHSWKSILVDGLCASAFSYLIHVAAERTGHGLESL